MVLAELTVALTFLAFDSMLGPVGERRADGSERTVVLGYEHIVKNVVAAVVLCDFEHNVGQGRRGEELRNGGDGSGIPCIIARSIQRGMADQASTHKYGTNITLNCGQ
ncbi:hypothetical protein P152DRAFT_181985 [Eremomyces bilateralis CBS 781.70]|uniref:Secreted protein n=1 Tax=Eremomyces bilateralis CBS 781.70 TaxID=1392243 RepID=A0A6G1GBH0_9PEZI|nr:uncharacterized protein P152DRAFT_181985 [Eremomyces bilateralis CBS 781.70]KAF1815322.1 hypothetical protein P152DRAFT_181985 [Eremomyces bilateralis CBS 781.70]